MFQNQRMKFNGSLFIIFMLMYIIQCKNFSESHLSKLARENIRNRSKRSHENFNYDLDSNYGKYIFFSHHSYKSGYIYSDYVHIFVIFELFALKIIIICLFVLLHPK